MANRHSLPYDLTIGDLLWQAGRRWLNPLSFLPCSTPWVGCGTPPPQPTFFFFRPPLSHSKKTSLTVICATYFFALPGYWHPCGEEPPGFIAPRRLLAGCGGLPASFSIWIAALWTLILVTPPWPSKGHPWYRNKTGCRSWSPYRQIDRKAADGRKPASREPRHLFQLRSRRW